jgi:leucyl aminopeptidase (aminopeptidase T)
MRKEISKNSEKAIKLKQAAETLVYQCGRLKENERVLVICDEITKMIGEMLISEIEKITDDFKLLVDNSVKIHGLEPSALVADEMLAADLIFGLTQFSLAHTKARLAASERGKRYLSLPDYSFDQLLSDALAVDFIKLDKKNRKIKNIFSQAKKFAIASEKGTKLTLDVFGRQFNYCPGFLSGPGEMSSPPDIEINIAPRESKSRGVIIVDGSVPYKGLGLVKKDIIIEIEKGSIKNISSENKAQNRILQNLFGEKSMPERKVLAEFGIGLNPRAKLCGLMLEDEGSLGTIHFGFGSNFSIGGKNRADLHIDFVVKNPDIYADNRLIMSKGKFII